MLLALWFSRKLQRYIDHHFTHDDFEDEQAIRKYKITAKIVIMTLVITCTPSVEHLMIVADRGQIEMTK